MNGSFLMIGARGAAKINGCTRLKGMRLDKVYTLEVCTRLKGMRLDRYA